MGLKVAVVLGTRPEIIKMAPIIYELEKKNIDYYIIHSGQHYSYNMDKVFFEQLKLSKPKYMLEVNATNPGEQTAKIILGAERVFLKNTPSIVLVQGDTNTVLGGTLAARKLRIKIGHVEAGLRSYDETMPEELNRKIADHCSDYLFAPTTNSKKTLLNEGISNKKIHVTGNTIVDAVHQNIKSAEKYSILEKLDLKSKKYFLISLHRQENVDNPKIFKQLIAGVNLVQKKYNIPIVYPIHPRSKKMANKFGISFGNIKMIEPLNYFAFLDMEKNAKLIMTDSGGVQEEACILNTPCITLRENTERPETVQIGANMIAGTKPKNILNCIDKTILKKKKWHNPFGDGNSGKKIIKIIK